LFSTPRRRARGKGGDPDEQVPEQILHLLALGAQELHVVRGRGDLPQSHAALDAPAEGLC
jgi:hypothetical protein